VAPHGPYTISQSNDLNKKISTRRSQSNDLKQKRAKQKRAKQKRAKQKRAKQKRAKHHTVRRWRQLNRPSGTV